jgi:branched-chain amino acid transport system permease protein
MSEHVLLRYKPLSFGRWLLWGGTALALIVLPLVFRQGFALTLMSQMGVMVIFALSYNMLLGQGGMLSFGHAVYAGLGAYFAIHTLNLIGKGQLVFPVTLLPLVGGLFGALFGVLFGWVTTKKAGTTFAMISLGIGEMVAACSLMLPGFFGGEGGVTVNRQVGQPFFGITYGPAIQVYYLIAAWTLLSTGAMYALTQTPLGRIANAVRDNPERAGFIGYDTHVVRFLQLVLASFFAGISGGLSAINFEIVSAENVGVARSGGVLLATFIGGVGLFFGPIIGAVIYTFFVVAISGMTKAWLLYLGLFFMAMVLYAPGGLASLLAANLHAVKAGLFGTLAPAYAAALATGVAALAGLIALVEMFYHLELEAANNPVLTLFGIALNVKTVAPWIGALAVLLAGSALFWRAGRRVRHAWGEVHAQLGRTAL